MKTETVHWIKRVFLPVLLGWYLPVVYASLPAQPPEQWKAEREQYQKAQRLLSQGRIRQFLDTSAKLRDYPLYPYLEYSYLKRLIHRKTPSKQVSAFLKAYSDTPLAPRIKHLWLRTLAKRGNWTEYLNFYDDKVQSVELKCYGLWATYKTGSQLNTLDLVQPIWLVGHSQPKACDPIFKVWREHGRLTGELAWQRFSMALQSGNTQLARYLIRFMPKAQQQQARLYRQLHFKPQKLSTSRYSKLPVAQNEALIVHAIKRLAGKDAKLAGQLWKEYQAKYNFDKIQTQQTDYRIVLQLARQSHPQAYYKALEQYPFPNNTRLLEAGIEMAIRLQQWDKVLEQVEKLPGPTRQTERWQYWLARASEQTSGDTNTRIEILSDLAQSRSYYGFLAADWLNSGYQLNNESYPVEGNFLEKFIRTPGIERAKQLWLLGQHTDARREWVWASRHFTQAQFYTAAYYASHIGWHSQAISSAVRAERWHDLKLRFPLTHKQPINKAAKQLQLEANWLYAVARQESALTTDARSPKGALGLMQLMPSTAAMVSKQHNLGYRSTHELLNPDTNIRIASHYLKDLLTRFKGNSIYATAAYNAGPYRVDQWLKKSGDMPIDIWIESIPYSETRQYVKNVLAYSVIFAQLQNQLDFYMPTATHLGKRSASLASLTIKPEK